MHRCLNCLARKTSRHTAHVLVLHIPLPNSPGISVIAHYGPYRQRSEEVHTFPSLQTDTSPVKEVEFTVEGIANLLVNRYILLWGCPSTL